MADAVDRAEPAVEPVDVSICAVTCRRPAGLSRLLESLGRLERPGGVAVEIVLVDNDPEASAFRAPDRRESAGGLPVRWDHEPRGDIARARNRCVTLARGRWIAFVDDDETVDAGWIAAYVREAARTRADGFFGPVEHRLEGERDGRGRACAPAGWLDPRPFLAQARHPTGTRLEVAGVFTSNAFVRRALLREVPFSSAFARTLGEDVECFLRARDAGAVFVACDEARVVEHVPPERQSARYLTRRALEGASAWSRIERARSRRPLVPGLAAALARLSAAALALPVAALGGRRRAFAGWLAVCTQAGRLLGLFGGRVGREAR